MDDNSYFSLGHLTTESCHPLTHDLSFDCENNIEKAIDDFFQVDQLALESFEKKISQVDLLVAQIESSIKAGGRVILCGCGATGRLSLSAETFFKKKYGAKLISFMAGGDSALIKSIEKFEDFTEFGSKQLEEFLLNENDLVVGITEGGETPFVIGAVEKAAQKCKRSPFFIYCNPDEELKSVLRSKKVIENKNIKKINLTCGPMALAGSTRLQASTVQLLYLCLALEKSFNENVTVKDLFSVFKSYHVKKSFLKLKDFIIWESDLYKNNEKVNYFVDQNNALSVLTDTTERAPTFGLAPFDGVSSGEIHSFVYCFILNVDNPFKAWQKMLGRNPRVLNWQGHGGLTGISYLMDMDISEHNPRLKSVRNNVVIENNDNNLKINFGKKSLEFELNRGPLWMEQIFLKMLLNTHSTIVMGRIGRFVENLMVWVRPSNGKLINRACRYADILLREKNIVLEYEVIEKKCLELYAGIPHNRSIVLEVVKALS